MADAPKKVSIVRTYKGDVAGLVSLNNITQTEIALAEAKKSHEILKAEASKPSIDRFAPKKRFHFPTFSLSTLGIRIGIGFCIGVALISVYAGYVYFSQTKEEASAVLPETLIFAEKIVPITAPSNAKPEEISDLITKELGKPSENLNSITLFVSGEKTAPENGVSVFRSYETQEFFQKTGLDAPNGLTRTLLNKYSLGVYYYQKDSPFFILETDYFQGALSGMFSFEPTLARKILPLFGRSILESDIGTYRWKDKITRNTRVRVFSDENDDIKIIYGFLGDRNLIITENETTFTEILTRLTTPKPIN
ncbi:MAG: hypothetical protein AAB682_02075 [Patescibacteria group bacterium]